MSARLYLLDARHAVERRFLLAALRAAGDLAGDDTLQVVPLRVAWRIPHFARDRKLRIGDFLWGDPRQPGRLRSRIILRRDPARAQCLRGAPAALGELRRRFSTQVAVEGNDA